MIFHYQNLRNCAGYLLTWFLGCFPMFFGCALGVLEKVWTRSRVLFQYPEQILQNGYNVQFRFGAKWTCFRVLFWFSGQIFRKTQRLDTFTGVISVLPAKFPPERKSLDTFTGVVSVFGANFPQKRKVWARLRVISGFREQIFQKTQKFGHVYGVISVFGANLSNLTSNLT